MIKVSDCLKDLVFVETSSQLLGFHMVKQLNLFIFSWCCKNTNNVKVYVTFITFFKWVVSVTRTSVLHTHTNVRSILSSRMISYWKFSKTVSIFEICLVPKFELWQLKSIRCHEEGTTWTFPSHFFGVSKGFTMNGGEASVTQKS